MSQETNRMFFFPLITFFIQFKSMDNHSLDNKDYMIDNEELKNDQKMTISNLTRNELGKLLRYKIFVFYEILLGSKQNSTTLKILLEDILSAKYFLKITNYSDKCIIYYNALLNFFKQKFDNLNVNEKNLKEFSIHNSNLFSPTIIKSISENEVQFFDSIHEKFNTINHVQLYNLARHFIKNKEELQKFINEKENFSNAKYNSILKLTTYQRYDLIGEITDNSEEIKQEKKNKENLNELEWLLKDQICSDIKRRDELIEYMRDNLGFNMNRKNNNDKKSIQLEDLSDILNLMRLKVSMSNVRAQAQCPSEQTKFLREASTKYSKVLPKPNDDINTNSDNFEPILKNFNELKRDIPNLTNPVNYVVTSSDCQEEKNTNEKERITISDWKKYMENFKNFQNKRNKLNPKV